MDNNEKRVQTIKEIINAYCDVDAKRIGREKLYGLLKEDTRDSCKLYRYRSFDADGYSLDEIISGQIYCSKPSSFNDPFDGKPGISFVEIYDQTYKQDMSLMNSICDKFILSQNKALDIRCYTDFEQTVMNLCIKDDFLKQLRERHTDAVDCKQKELFKNMISDRIMHMLLNDKRFMEKADLCFNFWPKFIKKYRALRKVESGDEIEVLTKALREICEPGEYDEIENKLMNQRDNIIKNLEKMMDENYGFSCFSTKENDRLMWAHYANSHSGFCIEYDFSNMMTELSLPKIIPVIYSKRRPLITVSSSKKNNNIEKEVLAQWLMDLITKDAVWDYEHEWRIILSNPNPKSRKVKVQKPSCIYMGTNISDGNRNIIISVAKQCGIPVKQMKLDPITYELCPAELL